MQKTVEKKAKLERARLKVPKKQGWKKFLYVFTLVVIVFAFTVVSQLAVGYTLLFILGKEVFSTPLWTAIYSTLSYILALILIVVLPKLLAKKYARKSQLLAELGNTDRDNLGLRDSPTWTDVGLAPVGFVASMLLAAGLMALFSIFPWFDMSEAQSTGFNHFLAGGEKILAFITLVVIAPVAEEIIFRGFLYGKLRKKFAMPIAILVTSLLFGLVHMQWNVGVNVFALSVVLCFLREITGTIYAGILAHIIKNAVAFYLLYVLGI